MSNTILIVDEDVAKIVEMEAALRRGGHSEVFPVHDARLALPAFQQHRPDLVILDLDTRHLDGFTVIQQLISRAKEGEYLPILVTAAALSAEARRLAIELGAKDFLPQPFDGRELVLRARNLLQVRDVYLQVETRVRARTEQLARAEVEIAKRLAFAAELRDYPDGAHPSRVGRMCGAIATELGLPRDQVELIRLAAPLHDIGKLCLPDAILLKPGALTEAEFAVVKTHTTQGAKMLTGTTSEILQAAEEIALYHHESWDGNGYTPGLAGEAIPIAGRIVSVADVFDALLHKRAYKPEWPPAEAIRYIVSQSGRKFDPAVVEAFERIASVEYAQTTSVEWEDFMSSVSGTFAQLVARATAE